MVCDQSTESPVLLSKDSYCNMLIIGCRLLAIGLITNCRYLIDWCCLCILRAQCCHFMRFGLGHADWF